MGKPLVSYHPVSPSIANARQVTKHVPDGSDSEDRPRSSFLRLDLYCAIFHSCFTGMIFLESVKLAR